MQPILAFPRNLHPLGVIQRLDPDEPQPEAERGDVGLMIILLPEHPTQHVGLVEMTIRDQLRSIGQVEADRVAFRQEAIAVLKHRNRPLALILPRNSGVRVSPCMMS